MKIKLARLICVVLALALTLSAMYACTGGGESTSGESGTAESTSGESGTDESTTGEESTVESTTGEESTVESTTVEGVTFDFTGKSPGDWMLEPSISATEIMPLFELVDGYNAKLPASVITVKNPTSTYIENSCGLISFTGEHLLNAKYENISYCYYCGTILAYTSYINGIADEIDVNTYKSLGEHGGHGLADNSTYWYNGEVIYNPYQGDGGGDTDPNVTYVVQECTFDDESGRLVGLGRYGAARGSQIIIPIEYEKGRRYSEGFCALRKDGKWAYFDEQGKRITAFEFDGYLYDPWMAGVRDIPKESLQPFDFSDGYVCVCKDGLWGIYNEKGEVVIPCRFEATRPVYNGVAWVKQNGLWGVMYVGE